jgi:methionine-gamma-lyase
MAKVRHEFGEHGGVNMSIEASTTFTVMDPHTMPEIFHGDRGPNQGGCYLYGRHFNPTVYNLSRQLAAMEGTGWAYCTASGMAAISATIMQLCSPGDVVVSSNTVYGGSYALMHDFLPQKCQIHTRFVDITDLAAVEAALAEGSVKLLYAESIANPTLRVANIPELSRLAGKYQVPLAIDNTFSPLMLSPREHGADIVIHSMTKFISGASDIIAGVVCADEEFICQLMDLHTGCLMILGPTMDPRVAFDLSLRIPHLPNRMAEHGRRALMLAENLEKLGLDVCYPGLENHPDHDLARELFCEEYGFGGVLTLDLGSSEKAETLMEVLQNRYGFGFMAVSLGYFDSLLSCSASSTSSEMTDEDMQKAGIEPGLIRISVGLTGTTEQRWTQLRSALADVGVISERAA